MRLRFLKVVTPVNRVEPGLQEEARPVPVANNKVTCRQALLVLGQHEINILARQVAEGLDDAVWGHNGVVLLHDLRELGRLHHVVLDLEPRVHDKGVLVEKPCEIAVGELGERMAHGHHFSPRSGRALQIVFALFHKERLVACVCASHQFFSHLALRPYPDSHIPCFSAYFTLFSLTVSIYALLYLPSSSTVTRTTGGFPVGVYEVAFLLP